MTEWVDAAIAAVAATRQGIITRAQLLALGLDDDAIAYRVKVGRLYRVYPGVYSVGRPPVTPFEQASAAVHACGPNAALSGSSGMTNWGFWRRWDKPFEVTILKGDRRPKGIIVHRSKTLRWQDTMVHNGIRTTKPARTILDITPRLDDLQLPRAVNRGLHTPYLHIGALAEQLIRHPNHPATKRLLKFVVTENGPTRSDWEYAFPAFCEHYGLPKPILITHVAGYEVDALFKAERVIVELDGWEFHNTRIDFENDRDRDADTLAAGYPTVRITWDRMFETPDREAARLHRILEQRRQQPAA
jgi:Transcriptional regulator, AbiEi antitoxin